MISPIDWEQFMRQAQVKIIGASDSGIKAEFYDVLSEFLNDSSIWTHDITVPYVAGTKVYPLFVPEGQIIRLSGVRDWGQIVPADNTPPGHSGILFVPALMPEIGKLVVEHRPDTSGYYQVTVVLNTALPTDRHMIPEAPRWLLPIWHVGLLDGLLGKMFMSPGKSYTDKTQAMYHLRRFRDAVGRARTSKLRANTNGASAWRFPQQFRSTSQQSGVPAIGSANERSF